MPASWHEGDQFLKCADSQPLPHLASLSLHLNAVEKWMAHVSHINAVFFVKILFEGKDHEHFFDVSLNRANAITAPRPNLRADVEKESVTIPVQAPRQPEVEFGPVDEDYDARVPRPCGFTQCSKCIEKSRHGARTFDGSQDRNTARIDQRVDACRPHFISTRAKKTKLDS